MRRARRKAIKPGSVALVTAIALLPAGTASANIGEKIIHECAFHEPFAGYTVGDYRQALKELDAGTIEYSDCEHEILQAELAASGGGTGQRAGTSKSLGSSGTPLTSTERSAVRGARKDSGPVKIGDSPINPGVIRVNIASALNTLPLSLQVLVIFMTAAFVLLGGSAARKKIYRITKGK